jgi:hypothetical protein
MIMVNCVQRSAEEVVHLRGRLQSCADQLDEAEDQAQAWQMACLVFLVLVVLDRLGRPIWARYCTGSYPFDR